MNTITADITGRFIVWLKDDNFEGIIRQHKDGACDWQLVEIATGDVRATGTARTHAEAVGCFRDVTEIFPINPGDVWDLDRRSLKVLGTLKRRDLSPTNLFRNVEVLDDMMLLAKLLEDRAVRVTMEAMRPPQGDQVMGSLAYALLYSDDELNEDSVRGFMLNELGKEYMAELEGDGICIGTLIRMAARMINSGHEARIRRWYADGCPAYLND